MDGFSMMLKAFGIDVDSADIKNAVEVAKKLIPEIAQKFDEMNATLRRIETQQLEMQTLTVDSQNWLLNLNREVTILKDAFLNEGKPVPNLAALYESDSLQVQGNPKEVLINHAR